MKRLILATIAIIATLAACKNEVMDNIYQFSTQNGRGETVNLEQYKGQVLLVVNTASKCGFTPQYDGLEALYQKYKDQGFTVLGFPCDQFGHQEPGSNEEIAEFCRLNHGVTFPLMAKSDVNGESANPVFQWLYSKKPFEGFGKGVKAFMMDKLLKAKDSTYAKSPNIKWNFTKFLIDKEGNVVARFEPTVEPEKLEEEIEALL